jgi:hypothetical protein
MSEQLQENPWPGSYGNPLGNCTDLLVNGKVMLRTSDDDLIEIAMIHYKQRAAVINAAVRFERHRWLDTPHRDVLVDNGIRLEVTDGI